MLLICLHIEHSLKTKHCVAEKHSSGVSRVLILREFEGASLHLARCACAGQSQLYAPWSSNASLLALRRWRRKRAWQWGYQS